MASSLLRVTGSVWSWPSSAVCQVQTTGLLICAKHLFISGIGEQPMLYRSSPDQSTAAFSLHSKWFPSPYRRLWCWLLRGNSLQETTGSSANDLYPGRACCFHVLHNSCIFLFLDISWHTVFFCRTTVHLFPRRGTEGTGVFSRLRRQLEKDKHSNPCSIYSCSLPLFYSRLFDGMGFKIDGWTMCIYGPVGFFLYGSENKNRPILLNLHLGEYSSPGCWLGVELVSDKEAFLALGADWISWQMSVVNFLSALKFDDYHAVHLHTNQQCILLFIDTLLILSFTPWTDCWSNNMSSK